MLDEPSAKVAARVGPRWRRFRTWGLALSIGLDLGACGEPGLRGCSGMTAIRMYLGNHRDSDAVIINGVP